MSLSPPPCTAPRVDRDPLLFRELHGLCVQDLRTGLSQLLRLLVGHRADALRLRNHSRIGRVHAVHVGADLAPLGAERGGHRDGGRIAAASPERRHLAPIRHALIAGDDDHAAARQLVLHAERPHLDDARVDVPIVRYDARLAAGEADCVAAQLSNRH